MMLLVAFFCSFFMLSSRPTYCLAFSIEPNENKAVNWNRRHIVQTVGCMLATTAAGVSPLVYPSVAAAATAEGQFLPCTAALQNNDKKKTPYLLPEYFRPASTAPEQGRSYFPTLSPPLSNRATYLHTLGRNAWALEQLLAFTNVTATIRSNVIQLQSTGGLWVHSPQWPTGEFCYLLDSIGNGAPVEHIVLPCNALEHKAPMKAFVQKYPNAKVWIAPGQYGPFGSCGLTNAQAASNTMGYRVNGILTDTPPPEWNQEFDMATLYVDIPQNAGPVSEVAFCHRPTQTLIATDAVVFIPPTAPDIFTTYFSSELVQDPTFWPRTVLQAVFLPLRDDVDDGSYPGFEALQNRLSRAPILRAFADARAPDAVRDWVTLIASTFTFDRIITSHFASPLAATPADFAACFRYLSPDVSKSSDAKSALPPIACQDWELLESLNRIIADNNLGAPAIFDYKKDCQ